MRRRLHKRLLRIFYVRGAHLKLEGTFQRLGLRRNVGKRNWQGVQKIEHLGLLVDTKAKRVYVSDRMVGRIRRTALAILLRAKRNSRVVSLDMLRRLCGVFRSRWRFHSRDFTLGRGSLKFHGPKTRSKRKFRSENRVTSASRNQLDRTSGAEHRGKMGGVPGPTGKTKARTGGLSAITVDCVSYNRARDVSNSQARCM